MSVKLVSEVGVGTIAAGVAKAFADHILIAGFEGHGCVAAHQLKHAGSPGNSASPKHTRRWC